MIWWCPAAIPSRGFLAAEKRREGIAAGAGELIGHHNFGAEDSDGRPANVFAFARSEDGEELALEFFGVEVGDLAAGIVALVDDDAVLVELGGELFVEGDDSGDGGVRHVHVADAAAGSFGDFAAIGFPPIEVARLVLAGGGLYGDVPTAVRGGLGVCLGGVNLSRNIFEISQR